MSENNDWKWIDGYENMYRIYRNGDIESVKRKYVPNNKILKIGINTYGYKRVNLKKDGKGKKFHIHRLIAIAFIPNPNPEEFDCVDHIDKNRLNNSIKNLRWISKSGNNRNRKPKGSSKYLGVSWHKASNKWAARISIDGKNKNLGYFEDEEEAGKAYMVKYEEMMFEFEKL